MKCELTTIFLSAITSVVVSQSESCYTEWYKLMRDVESSVGDEEFIVCPGTVLKPYPVLSNNAYFTDVWIYEDNVKIKCGRDGMYENSCSFEGGTTHIYIPNDDIRGVEISGFSFTGANETSVMAYGTPNAEVTFTDCVWKNNSGKEGSAINIWNTYEERGVGMTVNIHRCSFLSNTAQDGTILIEGGNLKVSNSMFKDSGPGWPIEVQLDGVAAVKNTCFENNPGPIYVYKGSKLQQNSNNWGNQNNLGGYNCNGAVIADDNDCSRFTAESCQMDSSVVSTLSRHGAMLSISSVASLSLFLFL